jgi:hypothetical protein
MAINVSSDGGVTWTNALILEADPGGGLNDKNWIVSDNQPANFDCPTAAPCHHPGRTYIVWDRVATVEIAYCDPDSPLSGTFGTGCDKIQNWSTVSGKTFQPIFGLQGIGSFPVVLNNGSVGVLFKSLTAPPCSVPDECGQGTVGPGSNQWALIAGAGATPFGGPLPAPGATTTVAGYQGGTVVFQRAGTLPQVAHDPVTDDLVAVWEDNRYRTDATGSPGNQNDAVFSASTNLGLTWSLPARVNQGPFNDGINHYNTTVAIGADGIWRVAYRQRFETGITALTLVSTPTTRSRATRERRGRRNSRSTPDRPSAILNSERTREAVFSRAITSRSLQAARTSRISPGMSPSSCRVDRRPAI